LSIRSAIIKINTIEFNFVLTQWSPSRDILGNLKKRSSRIDNNPFLKNGLKGLEHSRLSPIISIAVQNRKLSNSLICMFNIKRTLQAVCYDLSLIVRSITRRCSSNNITLYIPPKGQYFILHDRHSDILLKTLHFFRLALWIIRMNIAITIVSPALLFQLTSITDIISRLSTRIGFPSNPWLKSKNNCIRSYRNRSLQLFFSEITRLKDIPLTITTRTKSTAIIDINRNWCYTSLLSDRFSVKETLCKIFPSFRITTSIASNWQISKCFTITITTVNFYCISRISIAIAVDIHNNRKFVSY